MKGKFPNELAERLYELTLDGSWGDSSGDVAAPCGWFALVEDVDDADWIVRENGFGFVDIEGPFEHIDIDRRGYYQPARRRFEELEAEWSAWFDDDEEGADA